MHFLEQVSGGGGSDVFAEGWSEWLGGLPSGTRRGGIGLRGLRSFSLWFDAAMAGVCTNATITRREQRPVHRIGLRDGG